jgi:protein-disulfide isomerase
MMKYAVFVVIAAVFFAVGFMANSFAGAGTAKTGDQLVFISPPGCTDCATVEPAAREVANTLKIPFVKTSYGQNIQTAGMVLVYDNISTIAGVDSEYTLKTQVCLLTKNTDICNQAQTLAPPTDTTQPATPEVVKSDKPVAHAFVMSYCPYGLQFMKAYVPVIELLGNKADVQLNFVDYVMHGEKEMLENTRMYCIQKEQNAKFTAYLRCFVEAGDSPGCVTKVGIDSAKLTACETALDAQFSIKKTFSESTGNYPPYPVETAMNEQYGVGGSPTFILNGAEVSVSRSAEAIKQAVCAAFNTPPSECSQTLSSSAEAAGLGPMGAGGGSAGSTAGCG